jgi:uncharacterized lipoprotein YbaY
MLMNSPVSMLPWCLLLVLGLAGCGERSPNIIMPTYKITVVETAINQQNMPGKTSGGESKAPAKGVAPAEKSK